MNEDLLQKANRLNIKPAMAPTPVQTGESLLQKAERLGIKPMGQTKTEQPGYFKRVFGQYKQAGEDIRSEVKKAAQPTKSTFGDIAQLSRTVFRGIGDIAGAAFAPITEAPIIKPTLEKVGRKIAENPTAKQAIVKATELAKKYPEQAKDFESLINIVSLGTGKAVEAPIKSEIKAIGSDISKGAKALFTPSEEAVQKNIVELFNKSIKPTAKKTLVQGQKYENDTLSALRTIKNNSSKLNIEDATGELVAGRAPQTINELAQGVEQTKRLVFNQYDSLARKAGQGGAIIDAKPIADEISKVASNKALQLANPEIIQYANNWADRLRSFDTLDTQTTQEVIKIMNNNLQSFYKNPTFESASKAAIDASIANNFRQALDKAIQNATGEQYQILKNQYAALKAIENDVTRAAMRDARKNIKGLLDYTDIFTSGQIVGGILTLNPAMFTKGAIERGFKEYIKFLNDPNRAIENIFEMLDTPKIQPFSPTSATGKYLQNPKLGLSVGYSEEAKAATLLAKTDNFNIIKNTLRKLGYKDDVIKEIAPRVAQAKTEKNVMDIIGAVTQDGRMRVKSPETNSIEKYMADEANNVIQKGKK